MSKQVEAKFVLRPPEGLVEDDIHLVKEIVTEEDNTKHANLRIIKDFKRSAWITQEHYRNHKQKKESEDIKKLFEIKSTEKNLAKNIAKHLGYKYQHVKGLWDIVDSPYVYGIDIDSRAIIKYLYQHKYGDNVTPYTVTTFDIEVNTETEEIVIISIANKENVYVCVLQDLLVNTIPLETAVRQLNYCYKQHIPETDTFKDVKPVFVICKTEREVIEKIFAKLHEWKSDFIAIWNINYDIPKIIERCDHLHINLPRLFSSPEVPEEYKYFKYKAGNSLRVTESGVHKPMGPEEQWHTVQAPSYSYWIDAMCAHRFIRVGGKAVPGGYSLNNILEQELGKSYKKLKFDNLDDINRLTGIDWHKAMVARHPVEYVIYNCWDTMSMVELDKKTTDLETNLPILAGISSYDVYNSGPKKIIDTIHYFYLNNGRVLGCKPKTLNTGEHLPLSDWISILESIYIMDNSGKVIKENKNMTSNIRLATADLDAISSYPSDILAANVSKDTTNRELLSIEGIDRIDFMRQNINLFFGKVNHVEYCSTMLNFPSLSELSKSWLDNKSNKERT